MAIWLARTTSPCAERGDVESMGQRQSADVWERVAKSLADFDQSMGLLLNDRTLTDR